MSVHAIIGLSMQPDGGQRTVLFSAGKPFGPGPKLVAVRLELCRRNAFDSRGADRG